MYIKISMQPTYLQRETTSLYIYKLAGDTRRMSFIMIAGNPCHIFEVPFWRLDGATLLFFAIRSCLYSYTSYSCVKHRQQGPKPQLKPEKAQGPKPQKLLMFIYIYNICIEPETPKPDKEKTKKNYLKHPRYIYKYYKHDLRTHVKTLYTCNKVLYDL